MRSRTEVKLMNLRQKYRDYLLFLRSLQVIPLEEYRRVCARYYACESALAEYRSEHAYRDIA